MEGERICPIYDKGYCGSPRHPEGKCGNGYDDCPEDVRMLVSSFIRSKHGEILDKP
ncbi:MAG: hypothetical protein KKF56_01895 [Nanoarchaeota archaeon]|nr:hypothetical protein [Nanoarchaeota archaeon]